MKMNLPNQLTILRIIMIPFFVFFALADLNIPGQNFIALAIFAIASLTDMLDGKIARKYNLITNFGKFMDPLADKLLVCSALICFVDQGVVPTWIVLIIIAREFIISGFRLVASDNGIVIAAGIWGKLKTVCQMVMTILLLADFPWGWYQILEQIFIYASLILTVVSLVDYIANNIGVLKEGK